MRASPPASLDDLVRRALDLEGRRVLDLAREHALAIGPGGARGKGKVGELLERVLGATAASRAEPDFPALGVELKTLPLAADGRVRESTFVASFDVRVADRLEWEGSAVARKLSRVLFVPVVERARVGRAFLWVPDAEQTARLRDDFELLVGRLGRGEEVTAREGAWLQVRPKAADGTPTEVLVLDDGTRLATVRKGFYLRASVTTALLARAGRP